MANQRALLSNNIILNKFTMLIIFYIFKPILMNWVCWNLFVFFLSKINFLPKRILKKIFRTYKISFKKLTRIYRKLNIQTTHQPFLSISSWKRWNISKRGAFSKLWLFKIKKFKKYAKGFIKIGRYRGSKKIILHRNSFQKAFDLTNSYYLQYKEIKELKTKVSRLKTLKQLDMKKFNFLKFIWFKSFFFLKKNLSSFPLSKRVFTNQRLVKSLTTEILYKRIKLQFNKNKIKIFNKIKFFNKFKKVKKVIFKKQYQTLLFCNMHKLVLRKLRRTRQVHWKLQSHGRLNEERYNKFLNKLLTPKFNSALLQMLIGFFIQIFNFVISWKNLLLLLKYELIFINTKPATILTYLKKGDVIDVVTGFHTHIYKIMWIKQNEKFIRRVKKWSYLSFLCHRKRLMRRKKMPKALSSLPIGLLNVKKKWAVDVTLRTGVVLEELNSFDNYPLISIPYTSVLKLNNWRYRP